MPAFLIEACGNKVPVLNKLAYVCILISKVDNINNKINGIK